MRKLSRKTRKRHAARLRAAAGETMEKEDIRKVVRQQYGQVAKMSCCTPASCCQEEVSAVAKIPEGADLGLGCGDPVAISSLKEGETVLDLGAGAGVDCFLAANKVGPTGKVIGVDMTPEMVKKARENAKKGDYKNVEFKLGEIEALPVEDNTVDVVLSNCVINLSPEKGKVFAEAFRVLKPGGRMIISDLVLLKELPPAVKESEYAYCGCVGGASLKEEYLRLIEEAGFTHVEVTKEIPVPAEVTVDENTAQKVKDKFGISLEELKEVFKSVVSITVRAEKRAN